VDPSNVKIVVSECKPHTSSRSYISITTSHPPTFPIAFFRRCRSTSSRPAPPGDPAIFVSRSILVTDDWRPSLVGLREEVRLTTAISGSVDTIGFAFRGVSVGIPLAGVLSDDEILKVELCRYSGEGIRSIVSLQIALLCHLLLLVNWGYQLNPL
jgi:hypothetical protein